MDKSKREDVDLPLSYQSSSSLHVSVSDLAKSQGGLFKMLMLEKS